MSVYGFPWPDMLSCDKYPEDNDMCLRPVNHEKQGEFRKRAVIQCLSLPNPVYFGDSSSRKTPLLLRIFHNPFKKVKGDPGLAGRSRLIWPVVYAVSGAPLSPG